MPRSDPTKVKQHIDTEYLALLRGITSKLDAKQVDEREALQDAIKNFKNNLDKFVDYSSVIVPVRSDALGLHFSRFRRFIAGYQQKVKQGEHTENDCGVYLRDIYDLQKYVQEQWLQLQPDGTAESNDQVMSQITRQCEEMGVAFSELLNDILDFMGHKSKDDNVIQNSFDLLNAYPVALENLLLGKTTEIKLNEVVFDDPRKLFDHIFGSLFLPIKNGNDEKAMRLRTRLTDLHYISVNLFDLHFTKKRFAVELKNKFQPETVSNSRELDFEIIAANYFRQQAWQERIILTPVQLSHHLDGILKEYKSILPNQSTKAKKGKNKGYVASKNPGSSRYGKFSKKNKEKVYTVDEMVSIVRKKVHDAAKENGKEIVQNGIKGYVEKYLETRKKAYKTYNLKEKDIGPIFQGYKMEVLETGMLAHGGSMLSK